MTQPDAFSLAVGLGFHYWLDNRHEDLDYEAYFDEANAEWQVRSVHSQAVLGYRPSSKLVLYWGPQYSSFELTGDLTQEFREGSEQDVYRLDSRGSQSGLGFGVEYQIPDDGFYETMSYTLTSHRIDWGDFRSKPILTHTITIQYYF